MGMFRKDAPIGLDLENKFRDREDEKDWEKKPEVPKVKPKTKEAGPSLGDRFEVFAAKGEKMLDRGYVKGAAFMNRLGSGLKVAWAKTKEVGGTISDIASLDVGEPIKSVVDKGWSSAKEFFGKKLQASRDKIAGRVAEGYDSIATRASGAVDRLKTRKDSVKSWLKTNLENYKNQKRQKEIEKLRGQIRPLLQRLTELGATI